MTRPRRHLRTTNEQLGLAGALVLLGALVAALVWHAQSRVRSHRATAEEALRHQAGVAAWQYRRFATEGVFHAIHAWTASLSEELRRAEQRAGRRARDTALPRKPPPDCDVCARSAVRPRYAFRVDLPSGALTVIDSAAPPPAHASRRIIGERLAAVVGTGDRHEQEPHGFYADTVGGVLRPLAYGVARGPDGPRAIYGVELELRDVAAVLAKPLRQALLPPAVLRRFPIDSVLHVAVRTHGGQSIYESGVRPAGTLAAADTLEPHLGSLVATVTLRPESAPGFVIGGLPRTNWPLLGAVLALAALLMVLALVQLRRMRELARLRSRFVASVSHELRTPLAQISMFSETLLLDRARSEEERVEFLSAIFREARRLTNLVESVLRFSRADGAPVTARLQPAEAQDVSAEVADTLRGFAPLAAASDTELLSDVAPGIVAMVEPGAVRQLLLNLLDNAIKYGPRGQTVTVRLARADGVLRLAVEDEGPGVPPADRARVFEPFARIEHGPRSRVAGTGIGLSVVRDIAAAHGGRAWIEDAPGGGARVAVELPCSMGEGRGARDERTLRGPRDGAASARAASSSSGGPRLSPLP